MGNGEMGNGEMGNGEMGNGKMGKGEVDVTLAALGFTLFTDSSLHLIPSCLYHLSLSLPSLPTFLSPSQNDAFHRHSYYSTLIENHRQAIELCHFRCP